MDESRAGYFSEAQTRLVIQELGPVHPPVFMKCALSRFIKRPVLRWT